MVTLLWILRRALVLAALGTLGAATIFGCGSSLDSSSTTLESATSSEPVSSDSAESVSPVSSDPGSGGQTTSAAGGDNRFDRVKDALAAGDFSTMLELLQLSGLASEIEEREVTILAPTDDAFKELSEDQLADLATNPTKIDDILKRHMIDEVLTYDELAAKANVTTLSGETLAVAKQGTEITVEGAVVSEPSNDSVSGAEGQEIAVFSIDSVLIDSQ